MKHKIDFVATAALVGSMLCWATVPIFLKYFTAYVDGWVANGIRYPFAALLYLPWLIYFYRRGQLSASMWKLALLPFSINFLSQITWAWAPYYIDPGFMSFLVRLSTMWTVLGSFLLFKDERRLIRSASFWAGFSLAVAGFVFLTLGGGGFSTRANIIGITLILFTSLGWAGYQLAVRRNMQYVDSRAAFGMISSLTALGLISVMFTFGDVGELRQVPAGTFVLILVSGMVGIAAAHLLFYIAIKRIGVAIASSAGLASSFLTAILSLLIFGEVLTLLQWIAGIALITGGMLLLWAQSHVLSFSHDHVSSGN